MNVATVRRPQNRWFSRTIFEANHGLAMLVLGLSGHVFLCYFRKYFMKIINKKIRSTWTCLVFGWTVQLSSKVLSRKQKTVGLKRANLTCDHLRLPILLLRFSLGGRARLAYFGLGRLGFFVGVSLVDDFQISKTPQIYMTAKKESKNLDGFLKETDFFFVCDLLGFVPDEVNFFLAVSFVPSLNVWLLSVFLLEIDFYVEFCFQVKFTF